MMMSKQKTLVSFVYEYIHIHMCSNDFCTIFYDSERLWSAISLERLVTLTDGFNSCNSLHKSLVLKRIEKKLILVKKMKQCRYDIRYINKKYNRIETFVKFLLLNKVLFLYRTGLCLFLGFVKLLGVFANNRNWRSSC